MNGCGTPCHYSVPHKTSSEDMAVSPQSTYIVEWMDRLATLESGKTVRQSFLSSMSWMETDLSKSLMTEAHHPAILLFFFFFT